MWKKLLIFVGGLLSLTAANSILVESVENIKSNQLNEINNDICKTAKCTETGKFIHDSMDTSADPCDNFYEFACGNWLKTHTIPPDRVQYAIDDTLDETTQQNIRKELSKTSMSTDAQSVKHASDLFKACIDNATTESRGVEPLITLLNSVGGWPIIGEKSVYKDETYSWDDSLSKIIGRIGLKLVYAITVESDANDTMVNRVNFDAASFGIGRNQLVNRTAFPVIVNAYRKYILETALLLGAANTSSTHKDIDDLLDFESKLANFSAPREELRDSKVWYNKMSFTKFNSLTNDRIDWLKLTNKIFVSLNSSIRVNSNELAIIGDIPYYKGVSKLLIETPKRVIANYFGWFIALKLGHFTTKKFRDNQFEFNKITQGIEKTPELWRKCVAYLEEPLGYAVSRIYVDLYFSKKEKEEATLMIKDIKASFKVLVNVSEWLDDDTKKKSLEKLDAIIENVGYPNWILDNDALDNYYNLKQNVDSKKFFESVLYLELSGSLHDFESLRKPVNRTTSWPMYSVVVNAAYESTQNSITFPAGILKPPYFYSQTPEYMNYGGIGAVIGHEITHGFDDEGSQFDKNGNLINWWSDKIRKRFEEKAECFINNYSSYYDSDAKMNLNGKNTLGENIADNGGLREAFKAYQLYVQRQGHDSQRLPYIEQYTPEQVFYLSYANTWCTLKRPEALREMIEYNPHSPTKYRVNVPISNDIKFAETYNCKVGTKMNPKNKCVLW